MKKIIISIFFMLSTFTNASEKTVEVLGYFSNLAIDADDGDAHFIGGYNLRIYREGTVVFGIFGWGTGSPETEKGQLYDIKYNDKKKTLFFRAKLASGWESGLGIPEKGREARSVFTFDGKITHKALIGKLTQQDWYKPDDKGIVSFEKLRRVKATTPPKSHQEWLNNSYPPPVAW